jgi:hypothetical protein
MSEMVERVARALHEAHKPWCDYTYDFEHPMASREVYEALARAAIAAMREPTEGMIEARSVPGVLERSDIRLVWMAMVDAALK